MGYKEKEKCYEPNCGLFQENIISPILSNIYLHEFDFFIAEFCYFFHKRKFRCNNSRYSKLFYEIRKLKNFSDIKVLRKKL